MAIAHSIDLLDGIFVIQFRRQPTPDEFCRVIDEVTLLPMNHFRLWDVSCGLDWSIAQMESVADYAKKNLSTPSSKVAIVAPDDLTYGLFRVHSVHRESDHMEQVVFRNRDVALKWLNEQKEAFFSSG